MIFVCGVTGLRQNVLERMLVIRQSVKGLPQKLCSAKVQTPATLHVCMYVHMNVHVHVYGTLCICCMNVCMSCM